MKKKILFYSRFLRVTIFAFAAALWLFCFSSESAFAHKVYIYAWVAEDTVYTESSFGGNRMVKDGEITVFDPGGNILVKGKTNDKGTFAFKIQKESEMKIVLKAGTGHMAHWVVPVDEIKGIQPKERSQTGNDPLPEKKFEHPIEKTSKLVNAHLNSDCLTEKEVQAIVERAIEKVLKQDREPGITDIIGGIGYIIGLVGMGAYFNYRKKKN